MKKFIISALFVLGFGSYVAYVNTSSASSATPATTTDSSSGTAVQTVPSDTSAAAAPPTNTPAPTPVKTTPTPTKTPVVVKKATGQYSDGTYTGSAADAYYGNIQVKAVISGGKLTDVVFLQYPSDRSTSRYINEQAMPMLRAEALQAQSANVDGVSGASDSSAAFKQSLGSALAKARA